MKILMTIPKCHYCEEIKEFIKTLPADIRGNIAVVDATIDPMSRQIARERKIESVPALLVGEDTYRTADSIKEHLMSTLSP